VLIDVGEESEYEEERYTKCNFSFFSCTLYIVFANLWYMTCCAVPGLQKY